MSAKKFSAFLAVSLFVLGIVGQAQAIVTPSGVAGLTSWIDPSVYANMTIDGNGNVTNLIDSANASTWWSHGSKSGQLCQPTYSATAINGVPGLVYGTGSSWRSLLNNASTLSLAASHVTFDFFSVVTLTSSGANGLWGTQDTAGPWTVLEGNPGGGSAAGSLCFFSGSAWSNSAGNKIATDGTAQILEMVYDGSGATATMTMYKNGSLIAMATGLPASPDMTGFVYTGGQSYDCPPWVSAASPGPLGYTSYSYSGFHGAEGDMIWYNKTLSRGSDGFSGDAGNVGAYLQTKYGISGSYIGTVPEPGTLALLAAGLAALLCYAWRKRR